MLAFVAAFFIGRLQRSTPVRTPQLTSRAVSARRPESAAAVARRARMQDSVAAAMLAQSTGANAAESEVTVEKEATEEPVLPPAPPQPSPAELAAARQRAAENRIAIAARRAHADQLPDEFKKYYAQELPEDAISDELNVRARVSGAQAENITLSSPAFNEDNKDFVLEQVRSELTELGFKQVSITNGKGFTTKTRF
ncbi:hypothetical protein H8B13_02375 [Hymenobacter sp. BT188]|uniref:hypothetical protein n=1 Tax=Hymenobacter sp. BT188 TaxID=2763504 RepID=UPI00165161FB|nr:hypothetical protein [Hymenobacter sp. BT188]MBC6605655.1 hypothetical protein [Hymenobacter sp. BT188]